MMINQTIRAIWRVSILRDSPNQMPYSYAAFWTLLFANILFRGLAFGPPNLMVWALLLMNVFWLAVFLHFVMRWRKVPERFLQVFTVILGVMLLQVLILRLCAFLPLMPYRILSFLILVWSLVVMSHVLRIAAELEAYAAVLLVLLFEVVRLFLLYHAAILTLRFMG